MVLRPEQVTWTTIFHNYLRSWMTNFRGSRSENMSRGHRWCMSSVVQVIGGAGHRGIIGVASHRWCRSQPSSVVHVTGVIDDTCYKGSSAMHHNSYYILFSFCITFISSIFSLLCHKKHLTTTTLTYEKKMFYEYSFLKLNLFLKCFYEKLINVGWVFFMMVEE